MTDKIETTMAQTNPQCACGLFWSQTCSRSPCLRTMQAQKPHGCICPTGAEATCQGLSCPRRAWNLS
mgnify:CR=1 FL=1